MSSIRLRGLSSSEQFAQIADHLRSQTHSKFIQSSGIARVEKSYEATITLKTHANKAKALAIVKDFISENLSRVRVDDTFLGITTLASPETSANTSLIDIVAVHGLGGHGANTWTCSKPVAHVWLRDFLPDKFPDARVMSFGYESRVLSRSTGGVQEATEQLLRLLDGIILNRSSEQRPLVFIAHSLGGLVLKTALAKSYGIVCPNILTRTRCVAFFGTPHRGSESANWGEVMARIVSLWRPVMIRNLLMLRKNSDVLFDLDQSFARVLQDGNIRILSLYELEKTKSPLLFRSILVVPKQSALLNVPNEIPIPVNSTHRKMCKFEDEHEPAYNILVEGVHRALSEERNSRSNCKVSATVSLGIKSTARGQIIFPAYIPYDAYFVGRKGLMRDIQEHLLVSADHLDTEWPPCVALVGPPGIGKTSLAKRIFQLTKDRYDYAFFLSADSEPKLLQEFKDVFRLLNVGGGETPEDTRQIRDLVLDHLANTHKRWLLVFDNADEPTLLCSSSPHKGKGSILVTSRNNHICQSISKNTQNFSIPPLTEKQGEEFLLTRLTSFKHKDEPNRSMCRELARHYHCYPLVLRQLSAYMNYTRTSAQEMLDLLDKTSDTDGKVYSYKDRDSTYENSLQAAWSAVMSSLPADSVGLLNILCLFDPDRIPSQLFPQKLPRMMDVGFLTDDFEYRAARGSLLSYDIVTMADSSVMSIHRFVQKTRLKLISDAERKQAFDLALSTLKICFPSQILGNHMHNVWDACEAFLVHVLAFDKAVQNWQPTLADNAAYINMMCDCTWYLWEIGQYDEALRLLERIEGICRETIGLRTLEGARIYVNRGSVFSTLNCYEEAGTLFEEGLRIRSELLPKNDPLLANSYMQMGNYYTSQGQVDNAVRAHKRAIEIRAKSTETPDGIMIISHFNICRSLLMGPRLDEAEVYLKTAEELEPRLGQGREVLYYRSHRLYILGNIMAARGNVKEAHAIHVECYNIRVQAGSPQYTIVASLHKIGTLLVRLGEREEAIKSFRDAITLLESVLGTAKAKYARFARTEIKLAEISSKQEAASWRARAYQHYCDAFGHEAPVEEDWSQVDFDALVPPIDR